MACDCSRADTTEAAAAADAGAQVVVMATPVTAHSALLGVKNAIDASYVSSRRHLSRRVCQLKLYQLYHCFDLIIFLAAVCCCL